MDCIVECDYNTDLFDASTLERWLKHYQTLLVGIAVNPAETFGKLPILTDSEQKELTTGAKESLRFRKRERSTDGSNSRQQKRRWRTRSRLKESTSRMRN